MGKNGFRGTLGITGSRKKTKYSEQELVFLEESLKKEPRTYNSSQLAQKLEHERQITLIPDRLRRVLKKADATEPSSHGGSQAHQARLLYGNEPEKATKGNKPS